MEKVAAMEAAGDASWKNDDTMLDQAASEALEAIAVQGLEALSKLEALREENKSLRAKVEAMEQAASAGQHHRHHSQHHNHHHKHHHNHHGANGDGQGARCTRVIGIQSGNAVDGLDVGVFDFTETAAAASPDGADGTGPAR